MKKKGTILVKAFAKKEVSRPTDVIKATYVALDRYAQTFKHLARYDRGQETHS